MTTHCPDFEELSRFIDGELAEARRGAVAAHLTLCPRCTTLAQQLGVRFDVARQSLNGGPIGSACADAELLVGYLADSLSPDVRRGLEQHLRTCDACVGSVGAMHRRLRLAPEIAMPIPVRVRERAAVTPRASTHPPRALAAWLSALRDRLADFIKLPVVLVPAAVAAGALLVLATQPTWLYGPRDGIRGTAHVERSLRVTARQAPLRTQPTTRGEVVATLTRGNVVTLRAEERDWYRVTLPDGRDGWVEREAFE